nr:von Willebrand factor type A domain protein [uncultured bacterium]
MSAKRPAIYFLATFFVAICFFGQVAAQGEKKVAYGILIDNTGSLRTQFDIVVDVSKGIVEQTYRRGPISLFPFRTEGNSGNGVAIVSPDAEWSQDKDAIEEYIDSMFVVPGKTKLMDSISEIATKLNTKVSEDKNAFSRKVIFLITDGEDRSSSISEKDLIKLLKDSGVQVFAVGLVNELGDERFNNPSQKPKAMSFLQKVTKETGGRVVFAKTKRDDARQLVKDLFEKQT